MYTMKVNGLKTPVSKWTVNASVLGETDLK